MICRPFVNPEHTPILGKYMFIYIIIAFFALCSFFDIVYVATTKNAFVLKIKGRNLSSKFSLLIAMIIYIASLSIL